MATLAEERAAARERERRRIRELHAEAVASMVGVANGRMDRDEIAAIVAERRAFVPAEEIEATVDRVMEILRERRGKVSETTKKPTRRIRPKEEQEKIRAAVERALNTGQRPSEVIEALAAQGIVINKPVFYTTYWSPAKKKHEARIQGSAEMAPPRLGYERAAHADGETMARFPDTETTGGYPVDLRVTKVTMYGPEPGILARIDAEIAAVEARRNELLAARRVVAELLAA